MSFNRRVNLRLVAIRKCNIGVPVSRCELSFARPSFATSSHRPEMSLLGSFIQLGAKVWVGQKWTENKSEL
jgi:hypothetical protein